MTKHELIVKVAGETDTTAKQTKIMLDAIIAICEWEHNKGNITVQALMKIAQSLNVPITKFFEENNNVSNDKNISEPRRIPDNSNHV